MAKGPIPLTSLSEEQRSEASARFELLRPILEEGVSQAQIARTHQLCRHHLVQQQPFTARWLRLPQHRDGNHPAMSGYARSSKASILPSSPSPIRERLSLEKSLISSTLIEAANQPHQGTEEFVVTRRFSHVIELLIVDEAHRLRDAGLALIRDFADRGEFGLVLLGMPGLEKRLMHAPQLYSRVGFAQEMEPLSEEETHDFLGKRWGHRVKPHSDDFPDKEAVATIVRITRGNLRLIDRLMLQVEHVFVANQTQVVTKEVGETARQNLIIGPD
jgi:DNA transposition AAA+ family ATPase